MKFQNGNIKHENNNKNRLQIHTAALTVSIALLVIGFITAPSVISAQNTVVVPGITSSNNTTGTSASNATVATLLILTLLSRPNTIPLLSFHCRNHCLVATYCYQ